MKADSNFKSLLIPKVAVLSLVGLLEELGSPLTTTIKPQILCCLGHILPFRGLTWGLDNRGNSHNLLSLCQIKQAKIPIQILFLVVLGYIFNAGLSQVIKRRQTVSSYAQNLLIYPHLFYHPILPPLPSYHGSFHQLPGLMLDKLKPSVFSSSNTLVATFSKASQAAIGQVPSPFFSA